MITFEYKWSKAVKGDLQNIPNRLTSKLIRWKIIKPKYTTLTVALKDLLDV
jgi:hypothetical protein